MPQPASQTRQQLKKEFWFRTDCWKLVNSWPIKHQSHHSRIARALVCRCIASWNHTHQYDHWLQVIIRRRGSVRTIRGLFFRFKWMKKAKRMWSPIPLSLVRIMPHPRIISNASSILPNAMTNAPKALGQQSRGHRSESSKSASIGWNSSLHLLVVSLYTYSSHPSGPKREFPVAVKSPIIFFEK